MTVPDRGGARVISGRGAGAPGPSAVGGARDGGAKRPSISSRRSSSCEDNRHGGTAAQRPRRRRASISPHGTREEGRLGTMERARYKGTELAAPEGGHSPCFLGGGRGGGTGRVKKTIMILALVGSTHLRLRQVLEVRVNQPTHSVQRLQNLAAYVDVLDWPVDSLQFGSKAEARDK
jgi:hypothetical protein